MMPMAFLPIDLWQSLSGGNTNDFEEDKGVGIETGTQLVFGRYRNDDCV
jgi:hypothetical protein